MEEMLVESGGSMPLWLNMFLAIVAAFGGLELLKYLFSLRANRRKDKAQAAQEEATAGQSEADLRQKEYDLMNQFVATAKQQYEEMKSSKEEDRKIKSELRLKVSEHERKIEGLQRAFTESESRRLAAERLYCSVESCLKRKPPIGTYNSDAKRPRKSNGQFAPKVANNDKMLEKSAN